MASLQLRCFAMRQREEGWNEEAEKRGKQAGIKHRTMVLVAIMLLGLLALLCQEQANTGCFQVRLFLCFFLFFFKFWGGPAGPSGLGAAFARVPGSSLGVRSRHAPASPAQAPPLPTWPALSKWGFFWPQQHELIFLDLLEEHFYWFPSQCEEGIYNRQKKLIHGQAW